MRLWRLEVQGRGWNWTEMITGDKCWWPEVHVDFFKCQFSIKKILNHTKPKFYYNSHNDCIDRFVSRMQFSTGSSLVQRDRLDMACGRFTAAPHSTWAICCSLLPKLSILCSVTPQLPYQQHPNLPTVKLIWAWCVLAPEQWIECGLQV